MNPFYADSRFYGGGTTPIQTRNGIAAVSAVRLPSGRYVAAYDFDFSGVLRIGDIDGSGTTISLNLITNRPQSPQARVDTLASGGFIAAYVDSPDSTDVSNIYVRRFDAAGVAVGPAMTVNTTLPGNQ